MVVMTARPPVASCRREDSRCMAVVASCPDHKRDTQIQTTFSGGILLYRVLLRACLDIHIDKPDGNHCGRMRPRMTDCRSMSMLVMQAPRVYISWQTHQPRGGLVEQQQGGVDEQLMTH